MKSMLVDLAAVAGSLTAIVGCAVLISRLRPVRWLWRTLIANPLAQWFREQVAHEVEPRVAPVYERLKIVEDELRPNGGQSFRDQVLTRLDALEQQRS